MMKRPRYTFADYLSDERIAREMRARAARVPVFATTTRDNNARMIYAFAALVFVVSFLAATCVRADPRIIELNQSPCLIPENTCTTAPAPRDNTRRSFTVQRAPRASEYKFLSPDRIAPPERVVHVPATRHDPARTVTTTRIRVNDRVTKTRTTIR